MKKTFQWIGMSVLCLGMAGCSEDSNNEKYRSEPPMFEDFTLKSLDTGASEVHAGEKFVITGEQKKLGRLLNTTTYAWTAAPSDGVSQKYQRSAIYDQETQNPTDTLIITQPGEYTVTFQARYNASGNTSVWSGSRGYSFTESFADGNGKATYVTGGLFYFSVTAEKKIEILP